MNQTKIGIEKVSKNTISVNENQSGEINTIVANNQFNKLTIFYLVKQ